VLRARGGGTVWRRDDVDDKPGERLHFGLTPWRWIRGEREVEVTSRACALGAFCGLFQESTITVARHKALAFSLALY
jgi:hypothetical protein